MKYELTLEEVYTLRAGLGKIREYYQTLKRTSNNKYDRMQYEENITRATALSKKLISAWDEQRSSHAELLI